MRRVCSIPFIAQSVGPVFLSAGMGFERKKRNFSTIPITSPVGSSSGYYRQPAPAPASNSAAMTNVRNPDRTPSPPASAYFPLLSGDTNAQLRPLPDADIHFAYSTTLRRHHSDGAALTSPGHFAAAVEAEATSLWKRALLTVTGQPVPETPNLEHGLPTARAPPGGGLQEERKDTISAKFAHYSVGVRSHILWSKSKRYSILKVFSRIQWLGIEPTERLDFYIRTFHIYESNMAITNSQSPLPNPCISNFSKRSTRVPLYYCYVVVRL
jgi:hypothetical protein